MNKQNASGKIAREPNFSEGTFVDEFGVPIHYYRWEVERPVAVLQIAHGLGEHAQRYDRIARALAGHGIEVWADDHRGHGETGLSQLQRGEIRKLGNLGPGGTAAVLKQLHKFRELITDYRAQSPVHFWGHSWGSFLGQKLLAQPGSDYASATLTGSALMLPGNFASSGFNKAWKNEPNATGYEWLSRDRAVAEAFVNDPKTFFANAAAVLGVANSLALLGAPKAAQNRELPLLIMAGSNDPIAGGPSNVKLAEAYRRLGHSQVDLEIVPEARHELHNELGADDFTRRLAEFILKAS